MPARYEQIATRSPTPLTASALYVLQLPRLLRLLRLPRLLQQVRTGVRRGALGDGPLGVSLRSNSSMLSLLGYVLVFPMPTLTAGSVCRTLLLLTGRCALRVWCTGMCSSS